MPIHNFPTTEVEFINFDKIHETTGLTRSTLARYEEQGLFPRRVRLGPEAKGKIAWIHSEFRAWLEERLLDR